MQDEPKDDTECRMNILPTKVSKNTYSKYGLKHHISNEYEEKFTTGHGGQADRQFIMFKSTMLQNITQGSRVGQILCSDVRNWQQNKPLVNALIDIMPPMSCLQYSHNFNPYHFL